MMGKLEYGVLFSTAKNIHLRVVFLPVFMCRFLFQLCTLLSVRVTPSDVQYSAATKIWGCYRLASGAKVYREPAVMSSASSAVTYISVYTDSESGGYFREPTRSYQIEAAISFPPEAEVERLLAMPTPSPSPLALLSPPSAGERLARCTAPDASPLPLHMPPPIDRRDHIPETEMPPHKRLYLSTLGFRYEVEESSTARPIGGRGIDYGFINTLDAEARRRGIGE
nr:hypothetical protein [Tanacetum cinerariifolium]